MTTKIETQKDISKGPEAAKRNVAEITGTDDNDFLIGTFGHDSMKGLAGDDVLLGLSGDDTMDGGDGIDIMLGGRGYDVMSGGNGVDAMSGGKGNDTVIGNKGDDIMLGDQGDDLLVWNNGDGSDLMRGGEGYDKTQVNFFTDLVNEDLQNQDTARIQTSADGISFARTELNGQAVNGLFELDIAEIEALEVNFGGADDTAELVGNVAKEIDITLEGGADEAGDTLDLSELAAGAKVDLDVKYNGGRGLSQYGEVKTGGAKVIANDFENVIGTDFKDVVKGNAEDNVISGGLGNDRLSGLAGDDTIIGNKGDDKMRGGSGDDLLVWNNGDGSDRMNGGKGHDTTEVNFFTDLVNDDLQNDDTARFEEAGKGITFARTELNDQTVNGLFQLDIKKVEKIVTNFGGGDDTAELVGDVANRIDIVLEGGDEKTGDTLDLSELAYAAKVDLDIENDEGHGLSQNGEIKTGGATVIANDFENVIGTEFADEIFGNAEDNTIAAGKGNDVMAGGDGADVFVFEDHDGQDKIMDFDPDEDTISLSGVSNITDFDDLADNHIVQVGDNIVINDHAGTQITLENVDISNLDADSFLF